MEAVWQPLEARERLAAQVLRLNRTILLSSLLLVAALWGMVVYGLVLHYLDIVEDGSGPTRGHVARWRDHALVISLIGMAITAMILFFVRHLMLRVSALWENTTILYGIVDNTTVLIHVKDVNGRYRFVNRQFESATGKPREEILGRSVRDLHVREVADRLVAADNMVITSRQHIRLEEPVIFHGKPLTYLTLKFPLFEKTGAVFAVCGISTDITEIKETQRQLAAAHNTMRLAIDAMPGIFYVIEQGHRFVLWNRNFETVSGYDAEEMTRLHPLDLFVGEDRTRIQSRIAEVFTKGKSDSHAELVAKDGRRTPYYFTGCRVEFDGRDCLLGMGIDLSDLTQAQRALSAKTEELERSNRELEQFAYAASHDLQEPLRMIRGYLQLLKQDQGHHRDTDAGEFIGYALEGVGRMQSLIRDLLEYARVGRGTRSPGPVGMSRVIETAQDNLRQAIAECGARITIFGELPTILGNEQELVRLFQNLLGNAIKYRSPDRSPEIGVRVMRKPENWLFSIRDNGIGIDPGQFDRIFMIFQRLHGAGDFSGTGIGLAVAKKIVEAHGGKLWVESQSGAYSEFHVALPAEDRTAGADG
ncbi:MAG: sensor histidine kinase [Alphaproteobacteria bacterium]